MRYTPTRASSTCCSAWACRSDNFFALWKGADPDVPILKEAEAQYAKLQ